MAEIKIYGTLVNMTTDQKLALARQLYDETLEKFQDVINKETKDSLNTINESISSINSNLETIIIDNLTSDDNTKALSAKQGKVLKSLIDAIESFSIIVLQEGEDLPETGNINTIYFKKKEGSDKDIYNEYIYIENAWELIGSTEVDLSNYYTKDQVYSKTEVDEKEISWNKITEKPETYTPSKHTHDASEINGLPDPIQVDSELNSSSENPVQNKVINDALKNKLDSTALENYYNKEEIDSKISAAGGGDVVASGELVANNLIIGAGSKSIKNSGTSLTSLATKQELSKPTTFEWTNGTTEGPTGSLTGDNMNLVSYPAIPSASKTTSGVITTGNQSFSGDKTFERVTCEWGLTVSRNGNDNYPKIDFVDSNYPQGNSYITPVEYTGTANSAKKVNNKLKFTGSVTAEYDGSSEVTINIPNAETSEIPIALPNPYPIKFTGITSATYDGTSLVTINIPSSELTQQSSDSDTIITISAGSLYRHTGTTAIKNSLIFTGFSINKSSAIFIVPADQSINFVTSGQYTVKKTEEPTGTSDQLKVYAFQYLLGDIILVNCSIYK